MLWAIITVEREMLHRWTQAPEPVKFLCFPHRHVFKIKAWIGQEHSERDIEYIMAKRDLQEYVNARVFPEEISCEYIAREIHSYLAKKYDRLIKVEVMEDGENGCIFEA